MSRRYSSATITLVILFCRRPHCRKISVRQYYQKRVIFYPTTLQRTAFKKYLFLIRDIIISSWCLWWAVNTIHLRCLFRMNPLVWCLRADVAAELRSLRRYYHLSNGMESKSVDTRSIYRELGATLSYNMRLGNGMEMNPGWRRLCAKNLSMITGWRWIMTVISSMICRADVEYTRQLLKPHSAVRLADISGWGIAMVPVWNPRGTRWLVWTGRSDHQRLNCASAQFSFTGCWKGKFWGKKSPPVTAGNLILWENNE